MECLRNAWASVEPIYNTVKEYIIFVYSYLKYALPFFIVYLIHIISTNLYATLCANFSIVGFVNSLFLIGSPICSIILQIVTHTNTAFVAIISGLCIMLIGYVPRNIENARAAEQRPAQTNGGLIGRNY